MIFLWSIPATGIISMLFDFVHFDQFGDDATQMVCSVTTTYKDVDSLQLAVGAKNKDYTWKKSTNTQKKRMYMNISDVVGGDHLYHFNILVDIIYIDRIRNL